METKVSSIELRNRIRQLEHQKNNQLNDIKQEVYELREVLRPINLLRKGVENMAKVPGDKITLIDSTIGIAAGFVANKIVTRRSGNPIKRILGDIVQDGISRFMYNNSRLVKWLGQRAMRGLLKRQPHRNYY